MPAQDLPPLEMRRRIVALIRRYPGLHLREAARQLDTSVALVEYHVPFLVQHGLLRAQQADRYQRLFPVAGAARLTPRERRWLGLLREPNPLQVALYLLDHGQGRHGDIAQALGLGKSTLTFHLQKMERAGLVRKQRDGAFRLHDPRAAARLLVAHQPTPDLRERFARLWLSFYGEEGGEQGG